MEYETEILVKLWFMKMRVSENQRPLSELPRKMVYWGMYWGPVIYRSYHISIGNDAGLVYLRRTPHPVIVV